jgi:hypothetical protein
MPIELHKAFVEGFGLCKTDNKDLQIRTCNFDRKMLKAVTNVRRKFIPAKILSDPTSIAPET